MNLRLVLVFIDFALFMVLVALLQMPSRASDVKDTETRHYFVQTHQTKTRYNGTIYDVSEEIALGIEFEIDGVRYSEIDFKHPVTIYKSKIGYAIQIDNGVPLTELNIFPRRLGEVFASCLAAGQCDNVQLAVSCFSPHGGDSKHYRLSTRGDFAAKCVT